MAPPLAARTAGLPLHPLLAARRSPFAFDPSVEVSSLELATLLEAARWAPSHQNSQPWRFLLGRRGDEAYQRILARLAAADRRWAGRAPLLLVGAHLSRSETGRPLPHAGYDLGQAVAQLTVQAGALGLSVRQVSSFEAGALHAALGLPDGVVPLVVAAIGRAGNPASLPEDLRARDRAPRVRHPAAALLLG